MAAAGERCILILYGADIWLQIWGIGNASARVLYGMGYHSIKEVRRAVAAEEIQLTPPQLIGLRYAEDFEQRIPRKEVEVIVAEVFQVAERLFPGIIVLPCGSYRRGKATTRDVDILLCHPRYTSDAVLSGQWRQGDHSQRVLTVMLCACLVSGLDALLCCSGVVEELKKCQLITDSLSYSYDTNDPFESKSSSNGPNRGRSKPIVRELVAPKDLLTPAERAKVKQRARAAGPESTSGPLNSTASSSSSPAPVSSASSSRSKFHLRSVIGVDHRQPHLFRVFESWGSGNSCCAMLSSVAWALQLTRLLRVAMICVFWGGWMQVMTPLIPGALCLQPPQ